MVNEKVKPCTVPHTLNRDENGWSAHCKFCDFKSENHALPDRAANQGFIHGRENHYWGPADLYMDDDDLEKRREHRRRFRAAVGGPDEVDALNRAGL